MKPGESKPAIELQNVVKRFGEVTALKGATLDIRDNEFFTLLGPSGCGKTTLACADRRLRGPSPKA